MTVEKLEIEGVWTFTPKVFGDSRGDFFEWFQDDTFLNATGQKFELKQANCSISSKGTLRGIHFAKFPPGQQKYVTCFTGRIIDVVVDLRVDSKTFGKWNSVELNAQNHKVISIPNGIGHAFLALEDHTTVAYLCDQRYAPNNEFEINPLDKEIAIGWPKDLDLKISAKDESAPSLLESMDLLKSFRF